MKQQLTITVDEAARKLGVCRNVAYSAVRNGEIPSIRIGRRVLIPAAAFERMLAGDTGKSGAPSSEAA